MQNKMNDRQLHRIRTGYSLLGHLAFLTMLVFSLVWMFPRVCCMDSAYQVFDLVNSGHFTINDGRRSMVVSELLPLLFLKLHMPLLWIVAAYSAPHPSVGGALRYRPQRASYLLATPVR